MVAIKKLADAVKLTPDEKDALKAQINYMLSPTVMVAALQGTRVGTGGQLAR